LIFRITVCLIYLTISKDTKRKFPSKKEVVGYDLEEDKHLIKDCNALKDHHEDQEFNLKEMNKHYELMKELFQGEKGISNKNQHK